MKKLRTVLNGGIFGTPPEGDLGRTGAVFDRRTASLDTTSSLNTVETDVSCTVGEGSSVDFADCPFLGHRLYAPTSELCKQALGFVYLARDRETGATVVVKLVERGTGVTRHVGRELLVHRRCSGHPFITQLVEVFLTPRHLAIVLENVPGGDVLALVNERHGLAEGEARWLFQQLVVGMTYLHSLGAGRREMKLDNKLLAYPEAQPGRGGGSCAGEGVPSATAVMPTPAASSANDGAVAMDAEAGGAAALPTAVAAGAAFAATGRPTLKIQDFTYSQSDQFNSDPHSALGSLPYTAPEVLSNSMADSGAADVWALGVALFKMATGLYPFERAEDGGDQRTAVQAVLARIASVDYAIPPTLSPALHDLLGRMLVKDAAGRIPMEGILAHPWFLEDLEPEMLEINSRVDPERAAKQTEAVLRSVVAEAMASLRHVDSNYVDDIADQILAEEEASAAAAER